MIYVPDLKYSCYVLINKDTIRAYEQTPYNPGYNQQITINYRDYYITSSYLFVDGSQILVTILKFLFVYKKIF